MRGRVLAILLGTAACAESPVERTSVHTDSAGIDIALAGSVDVDPAWTFERVRVLGGDDTGEQSFFAAVPGLVEADGTGNLYVLDNDANRIVVFDSAGDFVRSMGREGSAPDEFTRALAFSVSEGGTASLFDLGKRGIMRFGPAAEVLGVVPTPVDYFGGSFHLEAGVLTIPRQLMSEAGRTVLVRMTETDTAHLVSLPVPQRRAIQLTSCGMAFSGMPPVFTPTLRWTKRGTRTVVATSAEYDLLVFDGDSLVMRIRRDIAPSPATAELAVQDLGPAMEVRTEGGVRRCDPGEVVEQRGYADVMPAIARLILDPAGRLWVERSHVRGQSAPIDVYDARGDYAGTLPASTPFPVTFLSANRMASIEVDELDVSRLVIHHISH